MSVTLLVVCAVLIAVSAAATGFGLGKRRTTERLLRESAATVSHRRMLALVVEGAPQGIAVVDRLQEVMLSNRRADEFGLVHDRFLDSRAWEAAEEVFGGADGVTFDLTSTKRRRGVTEMKVEGLAFRLGDPGGRYAVIYASDESEHMRMEAARRDFVANVSHELKTPVGAMALLAEALLESKTDPESVEYFGERVIKESHRLGNMVNELISLSKLQGAEKLPDMEVVAIDEVVDEAVRRSQIAADAKGIELAVDSPSGLEVLGDSTLLATALANLISNAINYSPAGSPVTLTRTLDTAGNVCIRVTDRGIGIAPENRKRVFERFFRVDKARSRATGGTGLGLAIVKHVAQNHDGSIRLWSKLGTGSTFTLVLPKYVETAEGDADDAAGTDPVGNPQGSRIDGETVGKELR